MTVVGAAPSPHDVVYTHILQLLLFIVIVTAIAVIVGVFSTFFVPRSHHCAIIIRVFAFQTLHLRFIIRFYCDTYSSAAIPLRDRVFICDSAERIGRAHASAH